MTEFHHGSRYQTIEREDGTLMQAVYRIQESQSTKECESDDCLLGKRILPTQKYARVFYDDVNVVEIFHVACFKKEFGLDNRY